MPSKKHTRVAMLRSRRVHPVKELRSVRPLGNMPVFVVRSKASMVLLRYMFTQRRQKPASERRRKGFGEGKGILVGRNEMLEVLTEDENDGVEVPDFYVGFKRM